MYNMVNRAKRNLHATLVKQNPVDFPIGPAAPERFFDEITVWIQPGPAGFFREAFQDFIQTIHLSTGMSTELWIIFLEQISNDLRTSIEQPSNNWSFTQICAILRRSLRDGVLLDENDMG